jgi:hypothetical protein
VALPTSASQTPWEDGLITILGAESLDRHHFIGMPWISMYSRELVSTDNHNPAGDPIPTGDPGHNRFTLYRKVLENNKSTSYIVIHGTVSWYDGPEKATPHDLYVHEFLAHSHAALYPVLGKAVLDDDGFDQSAETFYNARMWTEDTIQVLSNEVNKVDSSASGFKGSSADAFMQVIANMRDELKMLSADMQTNKDWVQLLHDNAAQIRQFLSRITAAYNEWRRTPEPTTMVNAVFQQLLAEASRLAQGTDDVSTPNAPPPNEPTNDHHSPSGAKEHGSTKKTGPNVPKASAVTSWPITISIANDYQTFDFLDPNVFSALNTFLQNIWIKNANTLDSAMIREAAALNDSLSTTVTNVLDTRAFVPPPSALDDLPGGGLDDLTGGGGKLDLSGLTGGGGKLDLSGLTGGGGKLDLGDPAGGGDLNLDDLLGGGKNNPDIKGGDGGGPDLADLLTGGGQDNVTGTPGGGSVGDIGNGDTGSGGLPDLNLGTGSNRPTGLFGTGTGTGTGTGGAGSLPAAAALVSALNNSSGKGTGVGNTTSGPAAGVDGLTDFTDTNGDGVPDTDVTSVDPAALTSTNLSSGENAPSLQGLTTGPGGTPRGGLLGDVGSAAGSPSRATGGDGSALNVSDLGSGNSVPNPAVGTGSTIPLPGAKSGPNAFGVSNPPPGAAFGLGPLGTGSSAGVPTGNGLWAGGGGAFGGGGGGGLSDGGGAFGGSGGGLSGGGGAFGGSAGGGSSDAMTAVSALPPTSAGNVGDQSAANLNGGSGYPGYPPPMGGMGGMGGGGGGGSQEKERERTTWLAEEEEVWGTDPRLGPAVIGRDEALDDEAEVPAWPQQRPGTGTPTAPRGPARGTTRAAGRG